MEERWSEADAREILEQWRRSGVPLAVFARERGFTPPRLYWWRRKFDFELSAGHPEAPATEALPELVPVNLRGIHSEPKAAIEVELHGGHVIRVRAGFDEEAFRRVVSLLEAAGC